MITPFLELDSVSCWYSMGGMFSGGRRRVLAVNSVSFSVKRGEIVGLVGESGCGKSTLARAIVGLERVRVGNIRLAGRVISRLSDRKLRSHRRQLQMVWQNPVSAVNPRKRVDRIIREPLDAHHVGTPSDREVRVLQLLDMVALSKELRGRYPHALSGGQLQRVGIARALALQPSFLVCDEPTASLDVSVRAGIINLLADLKDQFGLGMLFISHDLRMVRMITDRILIMYLGRIVEEVLPLSFDSSVQLHPYTQALFAATPVPDPEMRKGPPPVLGDVPSAVNPPSGCPYHPRCVLAKRVCREVVPILVRREATGATACHAISGPYHDRWRTDSKVNE